MLSKYLVSPRCIHKYSYMQCLESNSKMHCLDFTNVTPCIVATYRIGKPVVKVLIITYKVHVHVRCTGGQHNYSFHLLYLCEWATFLVPSCPLVGDLAILHVHKEWHMILQKPWVSENFGQVSQVS